jgi:hypothetical protein
MTGIPLRIIEAPAEGAGYDGVQPGDMWADEYVPGAWIIIKCAAWRPRTSGRGGNAAPSFRAAAYPSRILLLRFDRAYGI